MLNRFFVDWLFEQFIKLKIGSGDGLVPTGNKSLPESMLTQFYDLIWWEECDEKFDIVIGYQC